MSEEMSETQRTVERDLAVMQKAKIIRHGGSDKIGICGALEKVKRHENSKKLNIFAM